MKLRDLVFGKRKREVSDDFQYNADMSEQELVGLLMDVRSEEMMEQDPKKREHLLKQAQELTQLVAAKTDRPKRRQWTDIERRLHQQRQGLNK